MRYASMQTALCAVIIALFLMLKEYAGSRKEMVKEMDEYIERKAAIDVIMSETPDAHYPHWYADKIKSIPAVNVAPVRHGQWIEGEDEYGLILTCSVCGEEFVSWEADCARTNYCPNCGAKMDGGSD